MNEPEGVGGDAEATPARPGNPVIPASASVTEGDASMARRFRRRPPAASLHRHAQLPFFPLCFTISLIFIVPGPTGCSSAFTQ